MREDTENENAAPFGGNLITKKMSKQATQRKPSKQTEIGGKKEEMEEE
jgi:hypothetical protein